MGRCKPPIASAGRIWHPARGKSKAPLESTYYLTFRYQPPSRVVSQLERMWYTGLPKVEGPTYRHYLDYFRTRVRHFADLLQGVMVRCEPLTDAETLTYLHSTIGRKRHRVRVPATPVYLAEQLVDCPFVGGVRPQLGGAYLRTCSLISFPPRSLAGILDALNHLGFPFI